MTGTEGPRTLQIFATSKNAFKRVFIPVFMLRNNKPFLQNDKCAMYVKVLQQAQLNQLCIQMTAACTPPTQNSIEMCSTDVNKEHTNRHAGICFSRYSIPLWIP